MNPRHLPAALVFTAALALAGCAPYVSVSVVRPKFRPAEGTVAVQAKAGNLIENAIAKEKHEPLAALGGFLEAAEVAQQQLARDPRDNAARDAYNFAVARVLATILDAQLNPWDQPLRVAAAQGDFVLTHEPHPDPQRNPTLYDLTPADHLRIKSDFILEHGRKDGIGAPLVAVERGRKNHAPREHMMPKIYHGVTALIRFEGRRAIIAVEDPLVTERVSLAGHTFPLAADFSAPVAVLLSQQNPKEVGFRSFLRPEQYADVTRVARCQPYDPDKTVVLIIHGLLDTPATWAPMFNSLIMDEQIRRNYQFWFYSYPTGYPYPYSAAILRRELDAIQKQFRPRRKMVVIGHSMGGCISRLLITDTGEKLWQEMFKTSPDETMMREDSKALLREALIFRRRPEIGRVIFVAAPLRGSDLALSRLGRVGSALVELPHTMVRAGDDALRVVNYEVDELRLDRAPTSVDSLAPTDRFAVAIQNIPIASGIPYHVICGDQGRGGHKDRTEPVMTDGVVPYWSSHMDGAKSEMIVPCGHSVQQSPQGIAEVQRILKLHITGRGVCHDRCACRSPATAKSAR